ncbi:hypothetical protein KIW84_072467 [Lathyrus oleraceus]|uniref:Beta-amylase n=1 Tax=Pisum sativum TaxID=3888 RepID=A0A9D4VM95_PEA|nr:hypothetical protein KIW84_072467 [Pisum sativum]
MLVKHEVILSFTCMEMKDREQPDHANCSLERLVNQVKMATKIAGENWRQLVDFVASMSDGGKHRLSEADLYVGHIKGIKESDVIIEIALV